MSQSEAQAVYMVHYGEIALKGRNRIDFERQLIANLKAQYPIHRAYRLPGRIVLEGPSGLNLTKTFGVVWWSEAVRVPSDKSAIAEALLPLAEQVGDTIQTFAVRVTQGERVFEESTPHLEAEFGGLIDRAFDWRVDLSQPDRTFYIEVMRRAAYLYTQRHPGPRGLPVGASGRLLGLFSGGVDSVLAAYLMAKRGAEIELVHFYAMADAGQAHQAKIGALAQALAAYLPSLKIHYFPYHLFQLATSHLVSREHVWPNTWPLSRERGAYSAATTSGRWPRRHLRTWPAWTSSSSCRSSGHSSPTTRWRLSIWHDAWTCSSQPRSPTRIAARFSPPSPPHGRVQRFWMLWSGRSKSKI